MRNRNHLAAYYSPGYSPGYSQPYSPGYQPANWFGDFMGNLGNSWQGGEDAPMYGGNPAGDPYATVPGAYGYGQAVQGAAADVAGAVLSPVAEFAKGALRGVGLYVGLGIIAYTLIKARNP